MVKGKLKFINANHKKLLKAANLAEIMAWVWLVYDLFCGFRQFLILVNSYNSFENFLSSNELWVWLLTISYVINAGVHFSLLYGFSLGFKMIVETNLNKLENSEEVQNE